MTENFKKYYTIGCCGIDCGLCPRFHIKGDSKCPGCGGLDFKEKHPSCGFLTCCSIKNGLEVCSDCNDFTCARFDAEKNGYDSFVTHKKTFSNLEMIKNKGIDFFIDQQKIRINILINLLSNYDDGRSKSFFCISCALLPIDELLEIQYYIDNLNESVVNREKNKLLKDKLSFISDKLEIDLKLNNKP